jgi:hypothetical protein
VGDPADCCPADHLLQNLRSSNTKKEPDKYLRTFYKPTFPK